jgi:hypothetical protein
MGVACRLHGARAMRRPSGILVLTAVFASTALGGTSACTTRSCNALYAPSRATIERKVTTSFDTTKPIHAEICKNDDCESGDFVAGEATRANAGLCRTDGPAFETGCTFVRTRDGAFAFQASWLGEDTPFNDGDRYRVNLTSADGQPLVTVDAKATYSESEPNGEGCGTTKTAAL